MKYSIKIVDSLSGYNRKLDKRLARGELDRKPEHAIVMTPETFSKVFSPERLKLLKKVYRNNIKNIYQLARELDKPYEVVFRNIKYLEGVGLIRIETKGRRKIPHLKGDISVDMLSAA